MKNKKLIILFLSLFLLTGCTFPGLGGNTKKDVVIASGNTTERQIVSEIVKQMINKYTDLDATILSNLGSTTLIHTAMINDEVNISGGMYTGTSLTGELGMDPITDPTKALEVVKREYINRYNRIWYDSYGFENTYAFMVKREFAQKNNLKNVSDLKKLKDTVKVGIDSGWMSRPGDGYEAFKEKYGYEFKSIFPMEIALVYSAINNGEMDVVLGYSTDGRVNSYDLVVLKDDLRLFPPYDCSPVANKTLIDKYPELDKIFKALVGKISTEEMQSMNRMADEDLIEPKNVAKEFLEKNNYFKSEVDL